MNTCLMLRNSWGSCWDVNVPCTCTHGQCYATAALFAGMLTFLASAHMFRATQYCGVVRWDSYLDANLRISLCIFGDVQSSSSQCAWSRSSRFFEFEQWFKMDLRMKARKRRKKNQMKILKNVPNVWWNRHFKFKIAVLPYPQCTSTKLW